MKKYGAILGAAVILVIVGFSVGSSAISGRPDNGGRQLAIVSDEISESVDVAIAATAADPTVTVYFFPEVSDTTVTVLLLANTGNTSVQVSGAAYGKDGLLLSNMPTQALAPGQMKTTATHNFYGFNPFGWALSTNTAYVKLALPPGVVVEGYVAWSSASTYDPQVAAYTRPLRFTSVPAQ